MKLKYAAVFIVLVISAILLAGCASSAPAPVATPTPQIVYVTVIVTPIPTPTHCYWDSTKGVCSDQPVTAPPTTVTPTPTPIPTINKNTAAYEDYQIDLKNIAYDQTALSTLKANYLTEMQAAGGDVSEMRSLTIEYNELKAADEATLKTDQNLAAADLARANATV
ncbi:MAG: hypothetical protein ABSG49_05400 [Methanoregula sp.]|jgi:hypothetical protein|uniref:hypothetical protein n=1 Tax=Methanoregula sp. TaxID=2052170 RepID=UPI003C22F60C